MLKTQIPLVALLPCIAVDLYLSFKDKKTIRELAMYGYMVTEELESNKKQMRYLVDVLNRNNVELDDFDMIALPNIKKHS